MVCVFGKYEDEMLIFINAERFIWLKNHKNARRVGGQSMERMQVHQSCK
jgi:hypothetical protein